MKKVLQKQLALAMQEMIVNTGAPLLKKMETLRQIINFSISMSKGESRDELISIRDKFSLLIRDEFVDSFEDPEVILGKAELYYRMKLEDLHGEASDIINDQKLIPAYFMDNVTGIEAYKGDNH